VFLEDFSSRIWITYRKGFDAISDFKLTSDVNWGCMVRSSQMLVAQALIFHHLGRSWRKPPEKPYNPDYIGVLHLFGDSKACAFSIHNLLQAGRNYGLAAGSWLGPYAIEQADAVDGKENFPMELYVVSGDEDGERGGAPVVYIDVAAQLCSDFNKGPSTWSPILLLVPLVLGLDKINPRYIPLLKETFMFPQSLGILGVKPGTSTYIAGVQDDRALYLDPHEVQMQFLFHRPLESGYFCWSEVHFWFLELHFVLANIKWPETLETDFIYIHIIPRDAPLLESIGPQKCLAFSTDGAKFAIGGEDGHLRIFHWPSIKVLLDEPKAHKSFRDMDTGLDSEFLVSTSIDGYARIWKIDEGAPLVNLTQGIQKWQEEENHAVKLNGYRDDVEMDVAAGCMLDEEDEEEEEIPMIKTPVWILQRNDFPERRLFIELASFRENVNIPFFE
ncbi:hypothetical protein ACJX0J_027246, partial [Zea mays]